MNPSFNPKPPVSDRLRNLIYNVVKSELSQPNAPKESVVLRQVAQKHNLSMQRVAAIVKLKVAQEQFVGSGLALQKELNDGMEKALGVSQHVRLTEPAQGTKPILAQQMRQIFEMPDVEAVSLDLSLTVSTRADRVFLARANDRSSHLCSTRPLRPTRSTRLSLVSLHTNKRLPTAPKPHLALSAWPRAAKPTLLLWSSKTCPTRRLDASGSALTGTTALQRPYRGRERQPGNKPCARTRLHGRVTIINLLHYQLRSES